jgi:hypothetical protein
MEKIDSMKKKKQETRNAAYVGVAPDAVDAVVDIPLGALGGDGRAGQGPLGGPHGPAAQKRVDGLVGRAAGGLVGASVRRGILRHLAGLLAANLKDKEKKEGEE